MRQGADAASKLNRILRCLQDSIDRSAVDAFTGEGAVQIDHMQPVEPLLLKSLGLRCWIGVINRRLVHVAELQAHTLAVLEVDGGKQDHGCHLRKFAMRARPSA